LNNVQHHKPKGQNLKEVGSASISRLYLGTYGICSYTLGICVVLYVMGHFLDVAFVIRQHSPSRCLWMMCN